MIDHLTDNNMNVLGRLSTNEFTCRLASQTRRFSFSNPMGISKTPASLRHRNRLSLSIQRMNFSDDQLLQKGTIARRRLSTALSPETPKFATKNLIKSVRFYIEDKARLTNCKDIHICDGSEAERERLIKLMVNKRMITPLRKHENCWLARTDPRDVARVESKTFICTRDKHDVVPRGINDDISSQGGGLGNWMHVDELDEKMNKLLKNCMTGRTMYVIPFSMGPIGSNLSKVGIQLTDSPYVVASMHIMTRVSRKVLHLISARGDNDYVRCLHTVGCPLPSKRPIVNNWPCNPEETIISHIPERREIISYGSGYGGNSLLGKKCFALRLGSIIGRDEGWLAEHMLILGITDPKGNKKYVAAAFPSACGKTNLAMMSPTLPGYKIECVGDDIAWMRFDENGILRAINPEAGFFGVAPGTNEMSNPNAMKTIQKNTIFTNVAETSDGDFYWEGLEHKLKPEITVKDWLNREWNPNSGEKAAHPNSRFCSPASQCPIIDPLWESPEGVPISAIIFGGRRPEGVPLIYESFDWNHGVFLGASMRSESTAAAEHKAETMMHDPFAMRPFFGYNFGQYLKHWLSFGKQAQKGLNLPKIFHVNWFRKDSKTGKFLWPGYGENSRVLDWICRRIDGEECATSTPIGFIPKKGSINTEGLQIDSSDMDKLFSISREFWLKEQEIVDNYLKTNVGQDLPSEIIEESNKLELRLKHQPFESD